MTENSYKLVSNSWDQDEKDAIIETLHSGFLTMGTEIKTFESDLAKFHGVKHAIVVNSGSSANLIALNALTFSREQTPLLHRKRGVVIAPAVSWSTTYFPFVQMGYELRLVDVDDTFNIDVEQVREHLTDDCVGIITVNLLGVPAQNEDLIKICKQHGLFLFEDNCESFGAQLNGKTCGGFGDVGTLSFFYSHHINTIEGGAILTDDNQIANYARSIRAHGWVRDGEYNNLMEGFTSDAFDSQFKFVLPGYCVRPPEFTGAAGKIQLKKWPNRLKIRRENAQIFEAHATQRDYLTFQKENGTSSWFGFGCIFSLPRAQRLELWQYLLSKGIESRPIVAGNFANQPVSQFLNLDTSRSLAKAEEIDASGMFFGNDGIDLSANIGFLFKHLDEFMKTKRG